MAARLPKLTQQDKVVMAVRQIEVCRRRGEAVVLLPIDYALALVESVKVTDVAIDPSATAIADSSGGGVVAGDKLSNNSDIKKK